MKRKEEADGKKETVSKVRKVKDPLLIFTVNNIEASATADFQNVNVELTVADLSMSYPRNDKRFQKFLFFEKKESKKERKSPFQLNLDMKIGENSIETSVRVFLARLTFFPSLYFVQDTALWLDICATEFNILFNEVDDLTTKIREYKKSIGIANSHTATIDKLTTVDVTLEGPQMVILENFIEIPVNAFVGTIGLVTINIKDDTQKNRQVKTTTVQVNAVAWNRTRIDSFDHVDFSLVPLLFPVDFELKITETKEEEKKTRTVMTTGGLFRVKFSKADLMVGLKTIETWIRVLILLQHLLQVRELEKIKGDQAVAKALVIDVPINIQVELDGVDVTVIDDTTHASCERNVLRLGVGKIHSDLVIGKELLVTADVDDVFVDSYHWDLSVWEPTIEKVGISFVMDEKGERAIYPLSLKFNQKILVNVAPSFITSIAYLSTDLLDIVVEALADRWSIQAELTAHVNKTDFHDFLIAKPKKLVETEKCPEITTAPVLIENHIGIPVVVKSVVDNVEMKIESSINTPVGKASYTPGFRTSEDIFQFAFVTEKNKTESIPHKISWNTNRRNLVTGLEYFPLTDVVLHVFDTEKGKRVVVRTTEYIGNYLTFDLHIKLSGPAGEITTVLKPGGMFGIPYNFAGICDSREGIKLYLSPDPATVKWGRWKPNSTTVHCEPKANSTQTDTTTYVALTKEKLLDDRARKRVDWGIEFHPVIKLENALATDIKFSLVDMKKKKERAESLEDLKIEQTLEVVSPPTINDDVGIVICLPGFEPSKPTKLDMKPGATKEVKISGSESLKVLLYRQRSFVVGSQCLHIVIYVKTWIVNLTGLPLWYSAGKLVAGCEEGIKKLDLDQPPSKLYADSQVPSYYSGQTKNLLYTDSDKIQISPDSKSWSDDIEIGGLLPSPPVHIITKQPQARYSFIVEKSLGPGKFWRTSVIRIYPAYFLINLTGHEIVYRAGSTDHVGTMEKKSKIPLHFPRETSKDNFSLSLGCNAGLSVPLDLNQKGYFQVEFAADRLQTKVYLNVEIAPHGQVTYVVIQEPDNALYKFENQTPHVVTLWSSADKSETWTVNPDQTIDLFWKSPQSDMRILFEFKDKDGWSSETAKVDFLNLRDTKEYKGRDKSKISVTVLGSGFTKKVVCSRKKDLEQEKTETVPFMHFSLAVPRVEVSIINTIPMELLNIVIGDVRVSLIDTLEYYEIRAQVGLLQIDNQLPGSDGTMVYFKRKGNEDVCDVSLSVDTGDQKLGLTSFKKFKAKLSPIIVSVDLNLIMYLLDYGFWLLDVSGVKNFMEAQVTLLAGEQPELLTYKEAAFEKSVVVYIQEFLISALKVGFTFRTNLSLGDRELATLNEKAIGITSTIAHYARMSIEGVSISVREVSKVHLFNTPNQLAENLGAEYLTQVLFQVFKIVAGQIVSKVAMKKTKDIQTSRPTRFFDGTGVIFPFVASEARSMMATLEDGKYTKQELRLFEITNQGAVLITNNLLLDLIPAPTGEGISKSSVWSVKLEVFLKALHSVSMSSTTSISLVYYSDDYEGENHVKISNLTLSFDDEEKTRKCFEVLDQQAKIDLDQVTNPTKIKIPSYLEYKKNKQGDINIIQKSSKGYSTSQVNVKIVDQTLFVNKKQFNLPELHVAVAGQETRPGSWLFYNRENVLEFQCPSEKEAQEWVLACALGGAVWV
eukprot:TRINITY_DN5658_c0_g1_i2.p1 TRINITY_DN5658_c0_g1~~TRINITY_DN5658_c0_g1_i2.p1  ORF type:complete len:1914 (+),score=434.92 TRINITY_DN5658_c0_g1_i2:729-5744(+)